MLDLIGYADILAIPFFAMSVIYFHRKQRKTIVENCLYIFSLLGVLMDTIFSIIFLKSKLIQHL